MSTISGQTPRRAVHHGAHPPGMPATRASGASGAVPAAAWAHSDAIPTAWGASPLRGGVPDASGHIDA